MGPLIGFSYAVSKALQKEDETFGLVISAYVASENAIFVHLGLDSLPWQPYC